MVTFNHDYTLCDDAGVACICQPERPRQAERPPAATQVRVRVGALDRALAAGGGGRAAARAAHALARGTFALAAALDSGAPFAAQLAALRAAAPDDPVVRAALAPIVDSQAAAARARPACWDCISCAHAASPRLSD